MAYESSTLCVKLSGHRFWYVSRRLQYSRLWYLMVSQLSDIWKIRLHQRESYRLYSSFVATASRLISDSLCCAKEGLAFPLDTKTRPGPEIFNSVLCEGPGNTDLFIYADFIGCCDIPIHPDATGFKNFAMLWGTGPSGFLCLAKKVANFMALVTTVCQVWCERVQKFDEWICYERDHTCMHTLNTYPLNNGSQKFTIVSRENFNPLRRYIGF